MLTRKQKQILDFIAGYIKEKKYSPTLQEIKRRFKLSSVATIHQHIEALKNKGCLEKKSRLIEISKKNKISDLIKIPILGTITAGSPLTLFDVPKETIAIPKNKITSLTNIYALKVVGTSMINENINDGDIVLVRHQKTAENGQKVVALIDNHEATLKKFYKEHGHIRLQPANKSMEPLIFQNGRDILIQGIVLDVIRDISISDDILINTQTKQRNRFFTKKNKQEQNFKTEEAKDNNIFINNSFNLNNIYNLDCFEFMKNVKNNTIDLIFADPPYNLSKSNFKIKFIKSGGADLNTNKGSWDKFSEEDYENFTKKWLSECYRILKQNGSIWVAGTYHNIYIVGHLMRKIGFEILNEILWHKSDATPNLSCTRFVADHENFIWARKGKGNIFNYDKMKMINNNKQMRSIWTKGKTAGGKKIHPTQKPEWLLERVVLATSKPNSVIFDPFIGSGTTAVVAKKYSRSFIGTEIDPTYFEKSLKRLKETKICPITI